MLRRGFGFAYERIQSIYFGHIENPRDVVPPVTIKSARKSIRDDKKCSRRVRGHEVSSVVERLLFCVTPHHARPRDFVGSAVGEGDSPCRALHLNSYLRRDFKVMCLGVSRSGHQLEPVMGVDEVLQGHNENPAKSRGAALKSSDRNTRRNLRIRGISMVSRPIGRSKRRVLDNLVQAHAGYKLC